MAFIHRSRVTDLNLFAVYLTAMPVLEESDKNEIVMEEFSPEFYMP
jgi:hypothetical protein